MSPLPPLVPGANRPWTFLCVIASKPRKLIVGDIAPIANSWFTVAGAGLSIVPPVSFIPNVSTPLCMLHTRPTVVSLPHRSSYSRPGFPSLSTCTHSCGGLPVERHAFSAVCELLIEVADSKSPQPTGLEAPPEIDQVTSSTCAAPAPPELKFAFDPSELVPFVLTRNTTRILLPPAESIGVSSECGIVTLADVVPFRPCADTSSAYVPAPFACTTSSNQRRSPS